MGQFVEFQSAKPLNIKQPAGKLPARNSGGARPGPISPQALAEQLRARDSAFPAPNRQRWQRAPRPLPEVANDTVPLKRPSPVAVPFARPALDIEVRSIVSCGEIMAQWHDLCARAIEANGFQTPAFLIAGAQHLPASAPPAAILIWEKSILGDKNDHSNARLMGLIPLMGERGSLSRSVGARELKGYASIYHNLGVPHVDAARAVDVLAALFDWLASDPHGASAITWPLVPLEGAFATALSEAMARSGRRIIIRNEINRAVLPQALINLPGGDLSTIDEGLQSKHRREFARLERRLAGMGAVRYQEAEGGDLRDALEMFLALEASGWKGHEGTALLQTARSSAFIRTGLRGAALQAQARIVSLTLDGVTIAAGLVCDHGGRSWLTKIAHDETLSRVAPGIMLVRAFSRRQIAREDITLTDSCAFDETSFIGDIWPTRMALGDMTVGIQPGHTPGLAAVTARQMVRQRLRSLLKRGYHALRGALAS